MRYTTLLLSTLLAVSLPGDVLAERGTLIADCIVQLRGTKGGQTRLTVMPGTTPAYVVTPTSSRFALELVLDETYLLTFEHAGCVTKQLYVDANIPIEQRSTDFDFPLKVVLEHHEDAFTYAGPVGYIFYQHGLTDFTYTTDHTVKVNAQFMERMAVLQRTGVDPRSAHLGYAATTTPPAAVAALPAPLLPAEGTVAPMVAQVAPMVHRVNNDHQGTAPSAPIPNIVSAPLETAPPVDATPKAVLVDGPTETPFHGTTDTPVPLAVVATPAEHLQPAIAVASPFHFSSEVFVEERRVTTIIRITDGSAHSTEYRRVVHSTGSAYFFQDGRSITSRAYEQGTAQARNDAAREDPGLLQ